MNENACCGKERASFREVFPVSSSLKLFFQNLYFRFSESAQMALNSLKKATRHLAVEQYRPERHYGCESNKMSIFSSVLTKIFSQTDFE